MEPPMICVRMPPLISHIHSALSHPKVFCRQAQKTAAIEKQAQMRKKRMIFLGVFTILLMRISAMMK